MSKLHIFGAAGAAILAATAGAALLGGAAPAQEPAADTAKTCFNVRNIDSVTVGHTAHGAEAVNLRLYNHDAYQLNVIGPCQPLSDSVNIGVEAINPTGYVCDGPEAKLHLRGRITPAATCQVDTVRKLSAEEIASLPASERP